MSSGAVTAFMLRVILGAVVQRARSHRGTHNGWRQEAKAMLDLEKAANLAEDGGA